MLELAARLQGMGRSQLEEALARRSFDVTGVRDYFDLAEALLSEKSLDHSLKRRDRGTLAVLAAAAHAATTNPQQIKPEATGIDTGQRRADFALAAKAGAIFGGAPGATVASIAIALSEAGATPALLDSVAERLSILNDDLLIVCIDDIVFVPDEVAARIAADHVPPLAELAVPATPVLTSSSSSNDEFIERRAALTAFQTLGVLRELIRSLQAQPLRVLAKGGIGLPESHRLGTEIGVEIDELPHLMKLASDAGLIECVTSVWCVTPLGLGWLLKPAHECWQELVERLIDRIPVVVREIIQSLGESLTPESATEAMYELFPLSVLRDRESDDSNGIWLARAIDGSLKSAELLGLGVDGQPWRLTWHVVNGNFAAAAEVITALFPAVSSKVYLHNDLTVIAPGPLSADIENRLRQIANIEIRDLASSYRFNATSLQRGLTRGMSADEILTFLENISEGPIPQPLSYLVTETAARFGLVRVVSDRNANTSTRIESSDPHLIELMFVDKNLFALAFIRDGDALISPAHPEAVYSSLTDAQYPAILIGSDGKAALLEQFQRGMNPMARKATPTQVLLDRIEQHAPVFAPEEALYARALDVAVKARREVRLVVNLPNGEQAEYLLAPTAIANGRLRGLDRRVDIERTIPISSIVSVL